MKGQFIKPGPAALGAEIVEILDEMNLLPRSPVIDDIGTPAKRLSGGEIHSQKFFRRELVPGMLRQRYPEICVVIGIDKTRYAPPLDRLFIRGLVDLCAVDHELRA